MNKELLDFVSGYKNAVEIKATISREKLSNGCEYVYITADNVELYKFWYNPNGKKSDKPKHTGGKPSYAKIYLDKLRELKSKNISPELIGCMIWLADSIEWSTGLLVKGRGRNKKAVDFEDIMTILSVGRTKTSKIITELKKVKLLTHDNNGYKVNSELIKKGG
jgi:hypothetical protein